MMQQGCAHCEESLQLAGCVRERGYGLFIKCHKCGTLTTLPMVKDNMMRRMAMHHLMIM